MDTQKYIIRAMRRDKGDLGKALVCRFDMLRDALFFVHMGNPAMIDRLHDVWVSYGNYAPESYNFNQKGLRAAIDVRRDQRNEGIYLKRIIPRPQFMTWWIECCQQNGLDGANWIQARAAYFALCDMINEKDWRLGNS